MPRLGLAFPRQVAREHGDERGREGSGDHEAEDRVWDLERRQVGVEIGCLPEMRPDDG